VPGGQAAGPAPTIIPLDNPTSAPSNPDPLTNPSLCVRANPVYHPRQGG